MTLLEEFKEYQRLLKEGVQIDEIFGLFRSPEKRKYKGYKPHSNDHTMAHFTYPIVGGPLDGQSIEQMPRNWEMSFDGGYYDLNQLGKKGKYTWKTLRGGGGSAGGVAALNAFMPRF